MDISQFQQYEQNIRDTVSSIASRIINEEFARKAGEFTAFAGAGYGAYRFANSTVGQSIGSAASQSIGQMADSTGYTFNEMSASVDAYGRAYRPSERSYQIQQQAINEVSAGGFGAAAGVGSTAAFLGGGALLSGLGIAPVLNSAMGGIGSAAGSALGAGVFNAAGTAVGGGLNALGFSGAANVATGLFGAAGGGASSALGAVGGFAGGMALPIAGAYLADKATESVINNMAYQRGAEREIQGASFRFTPGMATNALTGRGLSYRDTAEVAASARDALSDTLYTRQGDLDEIMSGITEGDLLYNVRGAEEFSDKFQKVVESLRDISRIYGTTLEESTQMLGEMQRSGFYTTAEQTQALLASDAIGRMTGYTGQEVIQIGQEGASYARRLGLGKSLGYESATSTTLAIEEWVQNLSAEDRQNYLESIEEVGGKEQATQATSQFFMGLTRNRDFQTALFGVLNEEGEIDQNKLDALLSGETSYKDAVIEGGNIANSSRRMRAEFLTNAPEYFEKLEGPEFNRFMSRMVESYMSQSGAAAQGYELENILKSLGLEDTKLRQVVAGAIEGSGLVSEAAMTRESIQTNLREQQLERRSIAGVMERINNFFTNMGQEISQPFVGAATSIKAAGREFFNENIKGVYEVGGVSLDEVQWGAATTVGGIQESVFQPLLQSDSQATREMGAAQQRIFNKVMERRAGRNWRETATDEQIREGLRDFSAEQLNQVTFSGLDRAQEIIGLGPMDQTFTDQFSSVASEMFSLTAEGNDNITIDGQELTFSEFGEMSGLSSPQIETLNFLRNDFKAKIRQSDKAIEKRGREQGLPPNEIKRMKQEARQEITNEYNGIVTSMNYTGGQIGAIKIDEMLDNKVFRNIAGQLRAKGATGAAETVERVMGSDASVDQKLDSIYSRDIISALGDENLTEIFNIEEQLRAAQEPGEFSTSKKQSIISALQESKLFTDEDIEGLSGMGKDQFTKTVGNILNEEFINNIVSNPESMSYTSHTVEEYEKEWRDILKEQLMNNEKALRELIETDGEVSDAAERLSKSLDANNDLINDNTGILFNFDFSK